MVVAVAERGLSNPAAAVPARAVMSRQISRQMLLRFIVNYPDLLEGGFRYAVQ